MTPQKDEEYELQTVMMDAKVLGWRKAQFLRLDFDEPRAQMLAEDKQIDLMRVRQMVSAGCPPNVAFAILA